MRETILPPKWLVRFCGADCSNCETYKRFLMGDVSGLVNIENNYRCCWLPKDYQEVRTVELECVVKKRRYYFVENVLNLKGASG